MKDRNPIKELQSLIDDRGKLLERISGIHAALDAIKSPATCVNDKTAPPEPAESDEHYARLLDMVRDMQSQIQNQVRPLAEETVSFEVKHLRERAAADEAALRACLERLDECVAECIEQAHQYQRGHAELVQFSQRFAGLGATPESLPECPADISEIINSRLDLLRAQDKI